MAAASGAASCAATAAPNADTRCLSELLPELRGQLDSVHREAGCCRVGCDGVVLLRVAEAIGVDVRFAMAVHGEPEVAAAPSDAEDAPQLRRVVPDGC